MEGNGIFIPDFSNVKTTQLTDSKVRDSVGTKSSFVIPLFTLDDKYIGNLGLDYVSKKKRLTKDEWEHVQIQYR